MEFCGRQRMSNSWTNSDLEDVEADVNTQEPDATGSGVAAAALAGTDDEVPAARPTYRETLLDDASYLRQTSNRRCSSNTIAASSVDMKPFGAMSGSNSALSEGDKAFASLFAPPAALDNPNSFEKALQVANCDRKILLVNIQKHDSFEAHKLTRDVWRSEAVQGIICAFFTFWQRFSDHPEGENFCNLYKVDSFPHVCAIDPRTGRRLKVWSVKQIIDPTAATSELMDFAESKAATQIFASLGTTSTTAQVTASSNRVSPKRALSEIDDYQHTMAPALSSHLSSSSGSTRSEVVAPAKSGAATSEYVKMNTLLKTLHLERVKRRTPS